MQLFLRRVLRPIASAGSKIKRSLVILSVLIGGQHALAADAQHTLLVLGDSISAAYGMDLEQGWVTLMDRRLAAERSGWQVVNASISGDTTDGGLRRLPQLLESHQPAMVLIELGGNDGLRGFPIQRMRDNLSAMVQQAQARGAQVALLSMAIPPNFGKRYTDLFTASFGHIAESTGATLVPFILDGIATYSQLMQADGIHPTAAAQPMIVDNVYPWLEPLIEDISQQ
jgi:acyl-CoA thioesterase-1